MADYFVANGGSNTSPYDTWAKAATSFQTALTAAASDGDRVIIQYDAVPNTDAALSADTTYTLGANIKIIAASNDGGSAFTPTPMGTGLAANGFIGNSSLNRSITFSSSFAVYLYGLTLLVSGSSADNILQTGSTPAWIYDNCNFIINNTTSGAYMRFGGNSSANNPLYTFISCGFRFGHASQSIGTSGTLRFANCSVLSGGTAPTNLISSSNSSHGVSRSFIVLEACDLSQVTGTIFQANTFAQRGILRQCQLGVAATVLGAPTSESGGEVYVYDCAAGDEHYHFQYHSPYGSLTTDTSIYANDGAEYNAGGSKNSWKIVTTSLASFFSPFISPLIPVYHDGTGAITPNIEAVRSGSATMFKESELWSEWFVKSNSGYTLAAFNQTDRGGAVASTTDQATGALSGSGWTGENATSAFMKLAPSSSVTPAEIGDLCCRICFSVASSTVYLDPQIRGRS